MKRTICKFIICLLTCPTFAGINLPAQCEVGLPSIFRKKMVKESELERLTTSGTWGQNSRLQKYWTVYSDRSNNITYGIPSSEGDKYDELDFNEQVRIAMIEGDFALVYSEPSKGLIYPLISNNAKCRGWIPMKNLLLWSSCPTNETGIYNKALIVLNIDEIKDVTTYDDKLFLNPVTKVSPQKLVADMNFFFVMKKEENGLVLLAKECNMGGTLIQFFTVGLVHNPLSLSIIGLSLSQTGSPKWWKSLWVRK